jgi:hypothetical protein
MPATILPPEPTPGSPARSPKTAVSEQEIRDLTETMALPEVGYNIAAAAAKLKSKYPDANYQRWYKIAMSNGLLKAMHPATNPDAVAVRPADTIDRDAMITADELKEHVALISQEKHLSAGDWRSLGVSEDQAQRMISMEKFARQPLQHMVAATHGGLMFAWSGLLETYENCLVDLRGDAPETDKEGRLLNSGEVRRERMRLLTHITAELRQIQAQADKSNLNMLKAQQLAKELSRNEGSRKPKGRFGEQPLIAIKADAGSSVTIHEQPKDQEQHD